MRFDNDDQLHIEQVKFDQKRVMLRNQIDKSTGDVRFHAFKEYCECIIDQYEKECIPNRQTAAYMISELLSIEELVKKGDSYHILTKASDLEIPLGVKFSDGQYMNKWQEFVNEIKNLNFGGGIKTGKPIVVAICGMAGSGKSSVREIFQHYGYIYIHLGVTEEVIAKYGETNEELEKALAKEMREKNGMGVMAEIALPRIKEILKDTEDVVIDNMYSWAEYKIFKTEYEHNFLTIAVHASPKVRYERLQTRKIRPQDIPTSISRDYRELEDLDKGGPIAMADYNIINEGNQVELENKVRQIINEINLLKM